MRDKSVYYFIALVVVLVSVYAVFSTLAKQSYFDPAQKDVDQARSAPDPQPAQNNPQELSKIKVGNSEIFVEIADNDRERVRGLSGRESLAEDVGMLFLYDRDTIPAFWMYEMRFDIDIIWIRDSVVVDISENVPAPEPDTPRAELPRYYPSTTVDSILEVNAGFVEQNSISIGDKVVLPE